MKSNILFLIMILFSLCEGISQTDIILCRTSRAEKFQAKSLDGELLFELPPEHTPGVREKFEPFYLDDFYLYNFAAGIIGVKSPNGYYILNMKGEKVFESQNAGRFISKPKDGYIRVYETIEGTSSSLIKYYGNNNIQTPLNNTAYWEGSNFEGGHAIVQLEDKEGDWLVINTEGETVKNLTEEFGCEINSNSVTYSNS